MWSSETARRLEALKPQSAQDVRLAPDVTVTFSKAMAQSERALKTWLYAHLYRHKSIMDKMNAAEKVIEELFDAYMAAPDAMSEGWRELMAGAQMPAQARHVADFISGMTDNYALTEHASLFDRRVELR